VSFLLGETDVELIGGASAYSEGKGSHDRVCRKILVGGGVVEGGGGCGQDEKGEQGEWNPPFGEGGGGK